MFDDAVRLSCGFIAPEVCFALDVVDNGIGYQPGHEGCPSVVKV
jgi:hypothetical protein